MKKVIVTGASGFIGSSLVRKLVENHIEVLAIDVSFSDLRIPDSGLITKVKTDLDNVDSLLQSIPSGEYDNFYHFAWRGVNGADKLNPEVQVDNIAMAIRCATMAKKLGCKRFLCAGTIAEQATNSLPYLKATSGGMLYGVSKYCTRFMLETYCKNIGLNLIWMQFSNIYGPGNKTGNLISYTISQLFAGEEATFGPAQQPYDFIYIDDLIEAVYRLGNADNRSNQYFIGSGTPRRLKDYLLEIGREYGKEELIRIGVRPDDGVQYSFEMFDASPLMAEIGNYVSKSFTDGIRETISGYRCQR